MTKPTSIAAAVVLATSAPAMAHLDLGDDGSFVAGLTHPVLCALGAAPAVIGLSLTVPA
ncbi:hypothetical protein [Aureimonas mangrovi]|uniref:hypothetical protein n=1 Tax=Aureimonas mangrovi TaxID=2758041 RepID=UPI00163D5F5A|nr:hypothetical protein [Aureimonas mangrovi]